MSETAYVVLHTAPDGRSLPTRYATGELLVFRDEANAASFARGLVEAGLPEAILGNLDDVQRSAGDEEPGELSVFEDGVPDLDSTGRLERARRLALELGASLVRHY